MQRCIFCAATRTRQRGTGETAGKVYLERERERDYVDDDYSPFRSLVNCERVDILTGPKKWLFVVASSVVLLFVYKFAAKVAAIWQRVKMKSNRNINQARQKLKPGRFGGGGGGDDERVRAAVCKKRAKQFGFEVFDAAAVDTISILTRLAANWIYSGYHCRRCSPCTRTGTERALNSCLSILCAVHFGNCFRSHLLHRRTILFSSSFCTHTHTKSNRLFTVFHPRRESG